jgi:hypothetical protein
MNPRTKKGVQICGRLFCVAALTLCTAFVGFGVGIVVGIIYRKTLARVENPLPRPWGFTNEGEPFLMRNARQSDLADLPPGFIHYADTIKQLPLEEIATVYTDLDGNAFAELHPVEAIILPGRACSPARGWFTWGEHRKAFQCFQERWDLIWSNGPNGGGYFVGYDEERKRQIGVIGTRGFCDEPPPPEERFALEGYQTWDGRVKSCWLNHQEFLNCGRQVFHVELGSRQVRPLFEHLPEPARSVAVTPEAYPILAGQTAHSVVARTDTTLCLVDIDRQRPFASTAEARERMIPLPPMLQNRSCFIFKRLKDALTIEVEQRPNAGNELQRQASIYVLDADGTLGPPRDIAIWVLPFPARVLVWPLGSPLIQTLSSVLSDPWFWDDYGGASLQAFVQHVLWLERTSLAAVLGVGVALAALCYRRETRRRAPLIWRTVWPTFVLLFGIPGWVGYRFGWRWPPLAAVSNSPPNS